ncbi:MAG: helicase-exonuclease AddAB subunit AddA [Eubacteriales bacterium]|nr:helicase-exonuclease AddAB subunit AddA [Eubacteriales bacterium]
MADFEPTRSQKCAIESRGSSILVSAGAGSGKTRVLTERLMAYVTDPVNPVDIDSFLIITFTRAAAGELRGRITQELSRKLAEDPSNRRLRRQSAMCRKAQIGTIHSFCSNILRENSHRVGLAPDFKIMDDERAEAMKTAALDRVLEERYEKSDRYKGFLDLADTAGQGRDDRLLSELTLTLHEKMQCHARPEKWAREQIRLMKADYTDAGDTPWGREILAGALETVNYWSGEFDALMSAISDCDEIKKAYLPSLSVTADGLREYARCLRLGWDRAYSCESVDFPRLGTLRSSPDPELSERIKAKKAACKKAVDGVRTMIYAPGEKLLKEMENSVGAMEALLELTLDFDREYRTDKRRAGLVDYSDLEHLTAQLLTNEDDTPSEIAENLSKRYTEIMVDEYQDVSKVQDVIFSAISDKGRNLFFVGDVKQSIYRFRLADPGIFTEKYLRYKNADEAAEGEARRIMLQENFRSRREILECANTVFSLCMSKSLGDMDYDENASLKCGASFEGSVPVPEIMLLEVRKSEDDEETPDKTAMEARLAGRKIKELLTADPTLDYNDIAILMRSANSNGGIYRRELAAMGIPTDASQGGEFFTSVEVSTVMSLLSVIDNPHKDIPLIAVLRSPIFGFTADELSIIRNAKKDGDFYSALTKCAETNGKCADFLKKLSEFRTLAPDMGASEMLRMLINTLDMSAIFSAMTDGRRRLNNLAELSELSDRFDATGYRGLHRFVMWLQQLAKKGQSGVSEGSVSAVKIMTVHKSKGLEFPVVFLCDTARQFNKKDSRDTVLVHSELGLGPKVTDREKGIQYPTLARRAIKLRSEREMLSEEMRLLYVALTRPRERLFITATTSNAEKLISDLSASVSVPMPPQTLAVCSSPIKWLVSAALADGQKHIKLTVTSDEEADALPDEAGASFEADENALKELEQNLSFAYANQAARELPSKVTATELKGHTEKDEDALSVAPKPKRSFRMPDFAKKDKPLTGAERGIATHLALQYMDFAKTGTVEAINAEIERLYDAKFLSAREKAAVNVKALYKLFSSELGKRMMNADMLKREFKFSLLCDAGEIFGKAPGEEVLLQGVVDCCIAENGKLTVIDYKTDNVRTDAEIKSRGEFYRGQIETYAKALKRIFNMEVGECVLYFLTPGKEFILPPDR